MGRIIVCRHGNTFDKGDVVTRVGGRTDLPLSTSGKAQADALARLFADTSFRAAYCSSLQRTRETAAAILSARADGPDLSVLPFLTEIDYGPDENVAEDKVVARIGEDALRAWEEDSRVPDGWTVDKAAIQDGWKSLLTEAARLPEDSTILVVTSNGIARFLPDVVDAVPVGLQPKLKTGAWGEVACNTGTRILAWNQRPTV
ncbi:histidine phosphatase family protein [Hyphomonas adhaerens]|uniref:histidine phosphatase family protein n=1 Tax=Hyphomonas adhaerens TaxID=81029 RepID=UPI002353900A|nr:histidine phosphatase family protein [Hyphomonas adhaerens]